MRRAEDDRHAGVLLSATVGLLLAVVSTLWGSLFGWAWSSGLDQGWGWLTWASFAVLPVACAAAYLYGPVLRGLGLRDGAVVVGAVPVGLAGSMFMATQFTAYAVEVVLFILGFHLFAVLEVFDDSFGRRDSG
jgi:hypothetical protein